MRPSRTYYKGNNRKKNNGSIRNESNFTAEARRAQKKSILFQRAFSVSRRSIMTFNEISNNCCVPAEFPSRHRGENNAALRFRLAQSSRNDEGVRDRTVSVYIASVLIKENMLVFLWKNKTTKIFFVAEFQSLIIMNLHLSPYFFLVVFFAFFAGAFFFAAMDFHPLSLAGNRPIIKRCMRPDMPAAQSLAVNTPGAFMPPAVPLQGLQKKLLLLGCFLLGRFLLSCFLLSCHYLPTPFRHTAFLTQAALS